MCGIVVSLDKSMNIIRMAEKLKHRGLYTSMKKCYGYHCAHVRLPIMNTDHKYDCPYEIDQSFYLFNGEIFNYEKLDYEADIDAIENITSLQDGDYAIVKILPNRTIMIETDELGKKQLYYKVQHNKIIGIASEIKALIQSDDKLNMEYLSSCARNGFSHDITLTLSNKIFRFKPGYTYTISNNKIANMTRKEIGYKKLGLYDALQQSAMNRTVSAIPFCLLYSGGLDSTIFLNYIRSKKPYCYIMENGDDAIYAEKYCKDNNFKYEVVDFEECMDDALLASENACDLGSSQQNYCLFKHASKKYNVCLTGDGADELFSGYKRNNHFDFYKYDIMELQNYHLPRLEKLSMSQTIEYRSMYTSNYIFKHQNKIRYDVRKNKRQLKHLNIVNERILLRDKNPLKIKPDYVSNCLLWKNKLFKSLKNIENI